MRNLFVEGIPNSEKRNGVIEDAISCIQQDPQGAFLQGYLGVKNYSSFGDQRCDCDYGYGPKHGHIRFSVGRTVEARNDDVVLGPDEIYLLECVRDFGFISYKESMKSREKTVNLCEALDLIAERQRVITMIKTAIDERLGEITIETHEGVS